ncbi:MAG TPA: type II toxin-antitoxin system VapC family toxin, partial [Thermomicrobiales bacterium]|nr:type II toxin-antitoxin system VapC family toxin [Thermomicrobiales bacterium]
MIIDTSALVAIVHDEPDGDKCLDAILSAPVRRVSAGNLFETYIVIDGARARMLSVRLHELLSSLRIVVEPVTEAQVIIARAAYR